jgi:hypothetical protein
LQQRLADRGDPDPPADAVEDGLTELVFEQQYLTADGRLATRGAFRRPRERAGLCDGSNDLQLPQIHERRIHACRAST